MRIPELGDVLEAADRIAPYARRTPVLTCSHLDSLVGAKLFFKCENFQKVGAFKFRGACNAVLSLDDAAASRGVITHSSGNHAQALALAARLRGVPAHIVMPSTSLPAKAAAVRDYGGNIVFCEPNLKSREETAERVMKETGAVFIHPYNDFAIVSGQGTAARELVEEVPGLDFVLVPVGGGGLCSGTIIAVSGLSPGTKVVGAEPKGADDAARSLAAGRIIPQENPRTIADGLLTSLGTLTFEVIRSGIAGIVTVSEKGIAAAMRLVLERMKILIEPSSAVPIAALFEGGLDLRGRKVGVIVSGGNANLDKPAWL